MVALTTPLALSALVVLSAARDTPHRQFAKRQGTLVASSAVSFGKCTTPQIEGAVGLDNRVEFAFQPVDKVSYPHGSAQNIGIITQFVCDTLVNTCGATTAAHDLCESIRATVGAGKNNGALADKFNAAFGLKTNFAAAVGSISPAGAVVTSAATTVAPVVAAAASAAAVAPTVTVTAPCPGSTAAPVFAAAPPAAAPVVSTSTASLGSCSNPEILFKNGLDGRQQPAFIAANQQDFNHGSALNIAVITGFISQRFQSPCNASPEAVALAAQGIAAAQAAGGKTGAAADAWNAVFGIKSNFAAGAGN